jgi:hypothetical protein
MTDGQSVDGSESPTCVEGDCDTLPSYGPNQEYCFGHWMAEVRSNDTGSDQDGGADD